MENKVLECMKTRRSIRNYQDKPVPPELLNQILDAGLYAPSGMGKQSSVVVAVQDPETVKLLDQMNAEIMGRERPYYDAPVILLVFGDTERNTFVEDASCMLQNLMLAAHSLGLATCWIHREREMFVSKRGKTLMKQWGLSETLCGVGGLALGYAAGEIPEAAPRREGRIITIA